MKTKHFLILLPGIITLFISCVDEATEFNDPEILSREQSIETRLQNIDADLTVLDIQKLKEIAELAEDYELQYTVPDDGWLYVVLNMDIEHIELQFKHAEANKQFFEKANEINEKWLTEIRDSETDGERNAIVHKMNSEKEELRKTIFQDLEPIPWDLYIEDIQTYVEPDLDIEQFKRDYSEATASQF